MLASNKKKYFIIYVQINLSYTSVTDVGLLSLASISCLQNMTILHLKGLTAQGLVAALLACGGLMKVKLQASFKSLFAQPLFEHLEARGCAFQWSEKMFKVRLHFLFIFFLSVFYTFKPNIHHTCLWGKKKQIFGMRSNCYF